MLSMACFSCHTWHYPGLLHARLFAGYVTVCNSVDNAHPDTTFTLCSVLLGL